MSAPLTVYFAGDLFDHKHLIGNALLASFIDRNSSGRYRCITPQDFEAGENRKEQIRNQDLKMLMEADLGLFNFDGPDLDSGTVLEFAVARMLDIPSVILRTDFRNAGDQGAGGDNWNLMCSFYPRTEIVAVNSLEWYQAAKDHRPDIAAAIEPLYAALAAQVIEGLDRARAAPPLLSGREWAENLYSWALKFPGGGLESHIGDSAWAARVIGRKRQNGLIG